VYFSEGIGSGGGTVHRTWEWDGRTWIQRFPSASPTATGPLAYDQARERVVLYTDVSATTWEWDGTDWQQRVASVSRLTGTALAYDSGRHRAVLVGSNGTGTTETWEWDGTSWIRRLPPSNPPSGHGALAYDAARSRTVLLGIWQVGTWEWDGSSWTELFPPDRPPVQYGHTLVYDETRRRTVVHGGMVAAQESWEWDGTNWTRLPGAGPASRRYAVAAYDVRRQRTVLYGGTQDSVVLADTWELLGPSAVEGLGAPGGGLPIACTSTPRVGGTLCVTFRHDPPVGAGFHLLLLAPAPSVYPPLVLTPPGGVCGTTWLHVLPQVAFATTSNPADFCIPVPPVPGLIGAGFVLQGAALEVGVCFRPTDALLVRLQA
jgi:hypothetical protein